jgi:hypothetical protein
MKFKAWKPQVVDVDGQVGLGAVPQAVPSPRSKADREYFKSLSWIITYFSALVDSGKVSRVSEDAVIEGSQLLFYIGEWTSDGERVRSRFDV